MQSSEQPDEENIIPPGGGNFSEMKNFSIQKLNYLRRERPTSTEPGFDPKSSLTQKPLHTLVWHQAVSGDKKRA